MRPCSGLELLFFLAGQKSAGGHNVFASRGADGAGHAVGVEVVLEGVHCAFVAGLVGHFGRGVETDEVDAAPQSFEQSHQLGGVGYVVVEAFEHRVFEGDASLAEPVVFLQQAYDVGDGVGLLHWHHLGALVGEGIVQAHGHVDLRLVEQAAQHRGDAYGGDGDAVGAPAQAPVGGEHLERLADGVVVVQRLAHPHKDYVAQRLAFGDGENLVEYLGGCEAAVEALLAGDAKAAAHLASALAAYAERGAVAVGDVDRFYVFVDVGRRVLDCEEVFPGAVGRCLAVDGGGAAHGGNLVKPCAYLEREVGHRVEVVDPLVIHPVAQLLGGELREALLEAEALQLFER